MRRSPWLGLLALLAWSCAPGPVPEGAAHQRAELIGGAIDNGDPAVVSLQIDHRHFCTGTLISPLTILTAAHCIQGVPSGYPISVAFGTYAETAPTRQVSTVKGVFHPSYVGDLGYDVGLLQLSSPVTDVAPIRFNPTPLSPSDVGEVVRHVGFGVTDGAAGGGQGIKRVGDHPIVEITDLELAAGSTGQQGCFGDSGGPALMVTGGSPEERVVGVISHGYENDFDCTHGAGWDSRVDAYAGWIESVSAEWEASCGEDGRCRPGCVPEDLDCRCAADGTCGAQCPDKTTDPDCTKDCGPNLICSPEICPSPDPDCAADGDPCGTASQCQGRRCVTDPQHPDSYCSRSCVAPGDCPGDLECRDGLCLFPQLPEVQEDQLCVPGVNVCARGMACTAPAGGELTCRRACTAPADCRSGVCLEGRNGLRYCQPPPPVVLPRASDELRAPGGCAASGGFAPDLISLAAVLALLHRARSSRG